MLKDTGHSEDPHLTVLPGFVLREQERQKHEQTAVMHDPPDVDRTPHLLCALRETLDALGNEGCQLIGGDIA